ncbi:MAG: hypothetical protein HZC03_01310 [Candidatus Lloydbacteria bacterium]|nr:hypothetical protein [Candidatus Lloydbacteria bacterium]
MKLETLKSASPALFLLMVLIPMFFVSAAGLVPCGGSGQDPCTLSSFFVLIKNIIDFLLRDIATPLAAVTFAVAGWMYLTAAGDAGKIKSAHELFKNVAIGFIIALSAWLVVNAILAGLGVSNTFNLVR